MSALITARAGSYFLAGLAGSCLAGLAVHGTGILDPHLAVFQFVTSGALAGARVTA